MPMPAPRHAAPHATAAASSFELVIQDEFLIVVHADKPRALFISRGSGAGASTESTGLELSVEDTPATPLHGRRMPFDAIYGVFELLRGRYLALVTQSKRVARGVQGQEIRQVQKLELMLIATQDLPLLTRAQEEDEARYIDMLTRDIEAQSLHFAPHYDLTHSLQRMAAFEAGAGSIAERADRRFCWNYGLCGAFLDKQLFEWITPMMQAFISEVDDVTVKDSTFRLLFISRRSCRRQGTRFTMRGVDADGNVANFVETEQICVFADGRQTSYVQIRGSIPVFWSSPVTMKYAPKVFQRNQIDKDVAAFQRHAYELMELYGRVVVVNLIDKKKEQLKLGDALTKTLAAAAHKDSHILASVRLVWFDFHRECSHMQWQNLQKLIKQVDNDFQDYGYFEKSADGQVTSRQSGVMRTNCMDNLDRTNVVQSLFARRSLMLQLHETAALQGDVLSSPFVDLEKVFKSVWADNADAISLFYAGTGALKTDFTRTGKRTKQGALQDGYNSCLRYIKNNFLDAYRQDVLDLLLGRYQVSRSKGSPFRQESDQFESVESFAAKLAGMVVAFFLLESFRASSPRGLGGVFNSLVRSVWWTLLVCAGISAVLIKKGNALGKRLVRLPRFRPQDGCAITWRD